MEKANRLIVPTRLLVVAVIIGIMVMLGAVATSVNREKAFAETLSAADATQTVVVKSAYKETFKIDNDKATFKTSTKKVFRTIDGETKTYASTLAKYKTNDKWAVVPAMVVFTDKRFGTEIENMENDWPLTYVTGISAKAFKASKNAKTLTIYSTTLTKRGVKNSLKQSNITKVEVPKKCLKKYKRYFTKANCGKKVKVVALSGKEKSWPKGDWTPQYAFVGGIWNPSGTL